MEKKYYTVREASEYLSISEGSLYNMLHDQQIPHYKIYGRIRFDIAQLDEWMETHKVPANT